jgi:hypothetical protein
MLNVKRALNYVIVNSWIQIALSNSKKTVSFSSACTTKRFPSFLTSQSAVCFAEQGWSRRPS